MFIYFIAFAVAYFYLYYSENNSVSQLKGGIKDTSLLMYFLLYLAVFIGMGDMIGGYDRYIYGQIFDDSADIRLAGRNFLDVINQPGAFHEKGYMTLNYLISFVTANRYVFILICTLIMFAMYYVAIRRYTHHYPLACIVFLGFFYYFTATYMRQALAVGIVWLAMESIWRRRPVVFFVLVFIASRFHSSALVAAPLYFIGSRKYSVSQVIIFLVGCLILGLSPLPGTLLAFSGEVEDMQSRTADYVDDMGGVRVDYVLEVLFLMWLYIRYRHLLPNDKKTGVFVNAFFFFCGILLIFVRFGQGGRFGWYFMIGIIYVLSTVAANKRFAEARMTVLLVSFALFARITYEWAFNLTPYKTFLTNGYPSGERNIYDRFEYDERYTEDKLYRDPWLLW